MVRHTFSDDVTGEMTGTAGCDDVSASEVAVTEVSDPVDDHRADGVDAVRLADSEEDAMDDVDVKLSAAWDSVDVTISAT